MPGPCSHPSARTKDGRDVKGKTALKHANLRSGENRPIHVDPVKAAAAIHAAAAKSANG